jgi:hypothetical protein
VDERSSPFLAGPIAHQYCIGFLVPHTVSPLYYSAQEPDWMQFRPALPSWFAPTSSAAVKTLFQGDDGTGPRDAWLVPMVAWSSLLIVLFFVMLCINVLMGRQWIDSERLTFALASLPLALTEGSDSRMEQAPRVLRQPLFWGGLAIPLALQALAVHVGDRRHAMRKARTAASVWPLPCR